MYSEHKNIQIIVQLLKQFNISYVVISPGSRHAGLISSIENDDFFRCYSVVDERSAAFFALGLIQETGKSAAICCTSGTAACNYISAVTEAFYRRLPLVILTADRDSYFFNQQEDQMIDQKNIYQGICKKSVTLPIVKNEMDFWYCSRLVNEAFLELDHHGKGPVHINYPIEHFGKQTVNQLPLVTKINRVEKRGDFKTFINQLKKSKVLIIYGHNLPLSDSELERIKEFTIRFDCVLATEKESNIPGNIGVEIFNSNFILTFQEFEEYCPDIVVTMYGSHFTYPVRSRLRAYHKKIRHWHISEAGDVCDSFMCLNTVFECSPMQFFERCIADVIDNIDSIHVYRTKWLEMLKRFRMPDALYSDVFVVKQLLEALPSKCILHVGNGHISNLIQLGNIKDDISVYRNEATTGIDGVMSTFIGQASVSKKLCFLFIGDLSFFYDMNSLVIPYIRNNIRIFVNNNGCGETMYNAMESKGLNFAEMDGYIGAKHENSAKGWAIDRGLQYISVHDFEELEESMPLFLNSNSDKPILLEVFTDREVNYDIWKEIEELNRKKEIKISSLLPNLNYAIYGAGLYGKLAAEQVEIYKGHVVFFCDSNKEKWNMEYLNKPVISPVQLIGQREKYDKIIIGTKVKKEIIGILHAIGFDDKDIIVSV